MVDKILNFNVGVLGHVDSGKTSLSKALSTVASTACFDKNPQSKERGITLDLGFSSFCVDIPEHLKSGSLETLQFTLVDCPGHASLIRTIIGGAQIIDLMMLVVDITKGVQTQTAECLVIGEIACEKMIVVLNKTDMLPESKRQGAIEKMTKRLLKTLENTRFANSPVIPVAAKPGGPEAPDSEAIGVSDLIECLKSNTYKPKRNPEGPFIYAVDHCFSIRGQGTVMTGTVLSGSVSTNDTVELPSMKVTKKVKSMQMFKKPVDKAIQGDRLGICVTQFDPKQLERGLVCSQGALPTVVAAIISVHKIPYYKSSVLTKAKFHITMGHETVMGRVSFFGLYRKNTEKAEENGAAAAVNGFDFDQEYKYQEELFASQQKPSQGAEGGGDLDTQEHPQEQFALIELEKPVTCAHNCLIIGSKLDTDIHANMCRLAFHGKMLEAVTDTKYAQTVLPGIKVYKNKGREGMVERKADDYTVICRGLFKKESNMEVFVGLKVQLSTGEQGVIEGGFGQSGKFKVRVPAGLSEEANQILAATTKGKKSKNKAAASFQEAESQDVAPTDSGPIKVMLNFKRYAYDPQKKMIQT